MLNILLSLRPHFTDADKDACIPIISRMVELAEIARRHGVLQLEDETKQEDSLFLKTGIELVIDGTDPKLVKQLLTHLILADDKCGFELLSRLIMAEGALAIQSGENPRYIQDKLTAMLGEKYLLPLRIARDEKNEAERIKTAEQFLERVKTCRELSEGLPLEILMTRMPDQSVQRVLREVDSLDLTVALKGCGYNLIKKVFDNIPERQRGFIACDVEDLGPVRIIDVEEAQRKIIKVIGRLEDCGEILLR